MKNGLTFDVSEFVKTVTAIIAMPVLATKLELVIELKNHGVVAHSQSFAQAEELFEFLRGELAMDEEMVVRLMNDRFFRLDRARCILLRASVKRTV